MDDIVEAEAFLSTHSTHTSVSGDHVIVSGEFLKIAGEFIRKHDPEREKFFRKELRDKNCQARFSALYNLLKFQQQGIALQAETTEEIKKLQKSKNKENIMLVRGVLRRLKQEAAT